MNKALRIILITSMMVFLSMSLSVSVKAESSQETLTQYISDLQKNPNDNALRERIIKHVQTMKPAPAIPEEARKHFVMATAFQKAAKDYKGYELAIKEYKDALVIAPWWPEAYSNLGVVQKLAGQYDEAIQTLNLYLLTNPADARNAQDEIYNIMAAKTIAESEQTRKISSPAPSADKPKSELDVSGRWIISGGKCSAFFHSEFHFDGDNLVKETVCSESYTREIEGCGDPLYARGSRTITVVLHLKEHIRRA